MCFCRTGEDTYFLKAAETICNGSRDSARITHSALVLCTTKATTAYLQLPISLATWRMASLLMARLHCQLQTDTHCALNWSYVSLGAAQRCKCKTAAMLMSPAEWHGVLLGFRHMYFFQWWSTSILKQHYFVWCQGEKVLERQTGFENNEQQEYIYLVLGFQFDMSFWVKLDRLWSQKIRPFNVLTKQQFSYRVELMSVLLFPLFFLDHMS